jgi:hypothetical protein
MPPIGCGGVLGLFERPMQPKRVSGGACVSRFDPAWRHCD